jgi:recombinational DNA repair ATPase RecF
MSEPENHTLAWMRRIDAKLAELAEDVSAFRSEIQAVLTQLRDEVMVTSAIRLRLEARERSSPRACSRSTSG